MPKIFTKKVFAISTGGGTPIGGNDGLLIQELGFKLTILNPEVNATPTEAISLRIAQPESNAAQVEANALTITQQESNAIHTLSNKVTVIQPESLGVKTEAGSFAISALSTETITGSLANKVSISGVNEVAGAHSESAKAFSRFWASATTDNDSSRTTPANANGQNDTVVSIISTNLALADITNPVVLTSTTFGTPSTGTFVSKKIRVFFSVPLRTLSADTILLQYKLGISPAVTIYTHTGTALVNNLSGQFTFDITGLTNAQVQSISLIASYQASIVAVPETSIRLDAWCIELEQ